MRKKQVKISYLNEVQVTYQPKAPVSDKPLLSGRDAAKVLRMVFPESEVGVREMCYALFLNRSYRVMGYMAVSVGTTSNTVVDIAAIVRAALLTNASSIILAHNHPSGSLKASEADIIATQKFKEAADLFNIYLADHIILTQESYLSFLEDGLL